MTTARMTPLQQAKDLAGDAARAETAGDVAGAYSLYCRSIVAALAAGADDPLVPLKLLAKIVPRAETLAEAIPRPPPPVRRGTPRPAEIGGGGVGVPRNIMVAGNPGVPWDSVVGLDTAKYLLWKELELPMQQPQAVAGGTDGSAACRAVLLFGPGGTGKTQLARAAATRMSVAAFYSVHVATVMSSLLGDSEKAVAALFETAVSTAAGTHAPVVIFFDEIDALCPARTGTTSEAARRVLAQLLTCMDGMESAPGVFVLAATNAPWDLDESLRRRFQHRVYIGLPDAAARREILRHTACRGKGPVPAVDFAVIAEMTEGMSGADLANLVEDALDMPMRRAHGATHFFVDRDGMHWPCPSSRCGAVAMVITDVPPHTLMLPPATMDDFLQCARERRPSVGPDSVVKHLAWLKQYGQAGK